MGRIIVIEDNPVFADHVCRLLENKGYRTTCTSDCNGARKLLGGIGENDIVLSDLRLPDGDGIALLEELRKQGRNNPYIVMTDYDEVPTAVRSMKLGAEDYIPKKLLADNLFPLLQTLRKRTECHKIPIHERQSVAFREIDRKIRLVAPTNMSVLILGESGTGKEHIAERYIRQANGLTNLLFPWTAVCCPKNSPHPLCSDTRKARSRARKGKGGAIGRKPPAARCSLTRQATCRWKCSR